MSADVVATEAAVILVMTTDTVAMKGAMIATMNADTRDDMMTVVEEDTIATIEMIDDTRIVTTLVVVVVLVAAAAVADETMSATMSAATATRLTVANVTTTRVKSVASVLSVVNAAAASAAIATVLVAVTAAVVVDTTAIDMSVPVTETLADPVSQLPAVARHTPSLPHDLRHASLTEVRFADNTTFWVVRANFIRS
jgi:hypothetical protein